MAAATVAPGRPMGFQEALEKAGLKFERPPAGAYDFSAIKGKECFGELLRTPNFFNLADIHERAAELPSVERVPLYFRVGKEEHLAPNDALIDSRTHEHVNTVSKGYNLVQDRDLMLQMAESIKERDLAVVGGVHSQGHRLMMNAVFADPRMTIKLLHDYGRGEGRTIAGGFSFTNSYTSDLGIHCQAIGIDTFCVNFNPWGKTVKGLEVSMSHLKTGDLTKKVGEVLDLAISQVGKVQNLYNQADEVTLGDPDMPAPPPPASPDQVAPLPIVSRGGSLGQSRSDALFLLAGAGFAERDSDYIVSFRTRLEPAIADRQRAERRLTALTLNLAATAYVTHVADSVTPQAFRSLSLKAMRLLEADKLEEMREDGKEIVRRWDQARGAKKEATTARREAAVLQARVESKLG